MAKENPRSYLMVLATSLLLIRAAIFATRYYEFWLYRTYNPYFSRFHEHVALLAFLIDVSLALWIWGQSREAILYNLFYNVFALLLIIGIPLTFRTPLITYADSILTSSALIVTMVSLGAICLVIIHDAIHKQNRWTLIGPLKHGFKHVGTQDWRIRISLIMLLLVQAGFYITFVLYDYIHLLERDREYVMYLLFFPIRYHGPAMLMGALGIFAIFGVYKKKSWAFTVSLGIQCMSATQISYLWYTLSIVLGICALLSFFIEEDIEEIGDASLDLEPSEEYFDQ